MKKLDLAYIAGLVDGDGCISVIENGFYNPLKSWFKFISITNTNKQLLFSVRRQFKGIKSWLGVSDNNRPATDKTPYRLLYQSKHAVKVIQLLLPYLRAKKKVAQEVLSFPTRKPVWRGMKVNKREYNRQLRAVARIRKLNKRGN